MLSAKPQKEHKRSLAKDLRKKCALFMRRGHSTDVPDVPQRSVGKTSKSVDYVEYKRDKKNTRIESPDSDKHFSPKTDKEAETTESRWSFQRNSPANNGSASTSEKVVFQFHSESEESDEGGDKLGNIVNIKNSPTANLKRSFSVGFNRTASNQPKRSRCPRRRAEIRCSVNFKPIRLSSSDSCLPNYILLYSAMSEDVTSKKLLSATKSNTLDVPDSKDEAHSESVTPSATTPTTKSKFKIPKNVKKKFQFLRRRHTDTSLVDQLEQMEEANRDFSVSPSQLSSWQASFSSLLDDPVGLRLFQSFLRSEFSDENINFWIACQDFQKVDEENIRQVANRIYYDFIAVAAPMEINLDSNTRVEVKVLLENPTKAIFGRAQRRIQALMEKDSYPRFLRSDTLLNALSK